MTFQVQDKDGLTSGANAYVDPAYVREYYLERGTDLSATPDAELEAAVVKATQFIDTRYTFLGLKRNYVQDTEWPRRDAVDRAGNLIQGIPKAVLRATAELAFRALDGDLMADPSRDPTGQVIRSKREAVGPITEAVEYAAGSPWTFPRYPAVDRLLQSADLVRRGLTAVRS